MDAKAEKAAKKKPPQTADEKLDDALEDTFPASDPPARTEPVTKVGGKDEKSKNH